MAKSSGDRLQAYKNRIQYARKWRRQEGFDETWDRLVDLYKGKHFETIAAEDRIAVNVAFGTINVIYPSVSVNYPKITVNPTKPEATDAATAVEGMVNYYWKHYDFHEPFRRATKDFLIVGHGWLKVGWRFKENEEPRSPESIQEEFNERVAEADAYAQANPDMAHLTPTDEEIHGALAEVESVVTEDRPFVERVSYKDMFVDPDATCMEDADWIAQRVVRPLDEAKQDERYGAAARRRLQADAFARNDDTRRRPFGNEQSDDGASERVTIWEFYDLRKDTICIFSEATDEYLVAPEPFPYAFGQPFVMLANYEIPDQFYPLGDLEAIEPLQQELNKTRSQMMNARKHFARKYLYKESAFDAAGREALSSDVDMTMVPVADEQAPFSEVIAPMPMSPIPPDIYNHSSTIEQDISTVSGVSEYQRGQVPETRRTATEAAIISDSVNARAADKLAIIERGISKVGRCVVAICQEFLEGEQFARVEGAGAEQMWYKFDEESIQGEFDFEVEGGSTQPLNETARRQQATQMLQALAPFIGVVIDPMKLAAHVLQQGFGIKNPEQFLMQPPPPMPPEGGDPNAQGPPGAAPPAAPGGVGGLQPPPMGDPQSSGPGGAPQGAVPPEIMAQLMGQVGL